ncbi:hypothetical protein KJ359_012835 [Pestalotiopsis sp. 9143b]|nr:hypothetical protein KJ359_012835 [Pestalotiopsis sp. 9143b]
MPGKQKKGSNKRADKMLLPSTKTPSSKSSTTKPPAEEEPARESTKSAPSAQELASQQKLLSVFQAAYGGVLSSPGFAQTLQEVKAALYDREFERAFAREEYLDVYAARWSPTRALGYAAVLEGLRDPLDGLLTEGDGSVWAPAVVEAGSGGDEAAERLGDLSLESEASTANYDTEYVESTSPDPKERESDDVEPEQQTAAAPSKTLKVLALGGGTAELAAFVSFLSRSPDVRGDVTLVDSGPWAGPVSKLHAALRMPPPIYKYASAAAKAANAPLTSDDRLRYAFLQRDVLSLSADELSTTLGAEPLLITLLFTLNELYTGGGIGRTTALLRALGRAVAPGSLLLVVDSPGSYSEAAVGGKEKKKYPMSWLVDHTLLRAGEDRAKRKPEEGQGGEKEEDAQARDEKSKTDVKVEGCKWEKVQENESVWFRLSDELKFPIQLENMRYQLHLYRAISAAEKKK